MKHFIKQSFLAAVVTSLSLSGMAFAQNEAPYATFDVKLGSTINTDYVVKVTPEMPSEITKDTIAFHIFNNTGKEVYFVDGEDKQYIPLVSQNTVFAGYTPGKEYKVIDGNDNVVAKWTVGNAPIAMANVNSASAATFADWGDKLSQVIQNQQVTYEVPPAKPEPHYYNSYTKTTSKNKMVRGYW